MNIIGKLSLFLILVKVNNANNVNSKAKKKLCLTKQLTWLESNGILFMVVGKSQVSSDFSFVLIVSFSLVMSYFELYLLIGFSGGSDDEESACNAGDLGFIPGLGRSPG